MWPACYFQLQACRFSSLFWQQWKLKFSYGCSSMNLITKMEKQLSKFIYKSKYIQNYKCRNHNSFGAKPIDNVWWRSWSTSLVMELTPCLQYFLNSGVRKEYGASHSDPWDGIWWPGALADPATQFRLFFVHLNAHPDMSAVMSNENALMCWRSANRGVEKNGSWTEKGQTETDRDHMPFNFNSWEQNCCAACGAKGIQLPKEHESPFLGL